MQMNVVMSFLDKQIRKSSIAEGFFQQNKDKYVGHYRIFPGCTSFERMYGNAIQNTPKTARSGIVSEIMQNAISSFMSRQKSTAHF